MNHLASFNNWHGLIPGGGPIDTGATAVGGAGDTTEAGVCASGPAALGSRFCALRTHVCHQRMVLYMCVSTRTLSTCRPGLWLCTRAPQC